MKLYTKQRRLITRLATGEIKSELTAENKKILSGMEEHLFQVETALLEGMSATVTRANKGRAYETVKDSDLVYNYSYAYEQAHRFGNGKLGDKEALVAMRKELKRRGFTIVVKGGTASVAREG